MALARQCLAVFLAAIALATAPIARAQPAARDEARRYFEKGRVAYDLAEYEEAIAQFTRAYELSLEPVLIFNIAQANRMVGKCHKAKELYQRYVRLAPGTEEAETSRSHLAALKQTCPDDEDVVVPEPPVPPKKDWAGERPGEVPAPAVGPPEPAPSVALVARPASGGFRTAAWVGVVGGAVLGASSPLLYRWNQSRKTKHDLEAAALQRVLASDATDPGVRSRLEQSNRALASSIDTVDALVVVTATVGAAVALGSAAYLVFTDRPDPAAPRRAALGVQLAVGPGMTALVVSGRY